MKFEQLDEVYQQGLITKIENAIYTYLELCHLDDDIVLPTKEEYTEFFNGYDEDYEIDGKVAVSTVPDKLHSNYDIEIKNKKIILKVCAKNI